MSEPPRAPAVGVLGGTFDPVHAGHLRVAEVVRDTLGLARVLFVPAGHPPHKAPGELSPVGDRLTMLRLGLRDRPGFEISEIEIRSERMSYTVDTLGALAAGDPPLAPVFLLGVDVLVQLTSWHEPRRLVERFDLAVVAREAEATLGALPIWIADRLLDVPDRRAAAELEPGRGGRIFRIPMEPVHVSSSDIRRRVARRLPLGSLVPRAVAEYIHRVGLYRQEARR